MNVKIKNNLCIYRQIQQGKTKSFFMTKNKARMSIHHSYLTLYQRSHLVQQARKIKGTNQKQRNKTYKPNIFPDDLIIYVGNHKESTEKLPETTNSAKLQDTIAIYRNQLHFYIQATNIWNKTTPFKIASKPHKNLGIHLMKDVQGLYIKNLKIKKGN